MGEIREISNGTSQGRLSSKSTLTTSESPRRDEGPHLGFDLEKVPTVPDLRRARSSGRVSRIQSLSRRRKSFVHPLAHARTDEQLIVEFDGPDDPYKPVNWPYRKKAITTVLYALTTMGSTWASSA